MCASLWSFIACQYHQPALLSKFHIYLLYFSHNAELFSKNAFSAGSYINKDMAELDMTNERDYATYMALVSNNQGINGQAARDKLKQSLGNQTWSQYCSSRI